MRIRTLTPEQSPDWHRILHRLPAHDAYFLPEYHLAYERNGDGAATAFAAEEGGEILFHPFLVRPITRVGKTATTEGWSDIETVYGYSGPLATTTDPEFLRSSWSAFSDWCSEQRIVAEFIRFHPIADTTRFADASIRITRQRETVVLDLESTEEALWQSYPSRQRNMVRKARKRGLVGRRANLVADLETFHKLYRSTVERLQADRYYRFSRAYFSTLTHDEKNHVHLFEVRDDARVAAAALF
ncbi:MAG: peptidoglycan bridge formation glycyltransferase FemA/FemB family protein, partial [Acidobacteriota bacterium]